MVPLIFFRSFINTPVWIEFILWIVMIFVRFGSVRFDGDPIYTLYIFVGSQISNYCSRSHEKITGILTTTTTTTTKLGPICCTTTTNIITPKYNNWWWFGIRRRRRCRRFGIKNFSLLVFYRERAKRKWIQVF